MRQEAPTGICPELPAARVTGNEACVGFKGKRVTITRNVVPGFSVPRKNHTPPVFVAAPNWRYDIIAVGASAGGLQAIAELLAPLPAEFPAIVVVQHLDPTHKSLLAPLLVRKTGKRVTQAEHGEAILPGIVYIAPPDEHLLVGPGKIQLAHSQLVHFSRPSIDLLFESVAGMYGSRSMGVVLSGSNRDGSVGIRAIKEAGGTTLAQDPATAEYSTMPRSAIATQCVDYTVPLKGLAGKITQLFREKVAAS